MTRRLANAVERAATRSVSREAASWSLATISAVRSDGTVDLTTATGDVERIRRLRSYASPQVGDRVQVAKSPSGNWLVAGATAAGSDEWQPLSLRSGFTASSASGDAPPACRRTSDGLVALSGIVNPTGLSTSASIVIADLPAGIRPEYRGACVVVGDGLTARLYINIAGSISIRLISGTNPSWLSLDGAQCR
ncbi:hypothetical protein ACH4OV_25245 [Streptomyces diastaticus]|uniref:hypothetical protein n=1 Tax=Streptomyces diastaticus TaxID=1956 RepID=UPI0037AB8CB0